MSAVLVQKRKIDRQNCFYRQMWWCRVYPPKKKILLYVSHNNTNGNIYIGSTCEPTLARWLAKHVKSYVAHLKNNSIRKTTNFEILENGDYSIILLELCPCNSKDELYKRERYYIESMKCVKTILKYTIQCITQIINRSWKKLRQKHFDCICGGSFTFANIKKT